MSKSRDSPDEIRDRKSKLIILTISSGVGTKSYESVPACDWEEKRGNIPKFRHSHISRFPKISTKPGKTHAIPSHSAFRIETSIAVCADPVPSPRQPPIYGILRSKMGQGRLCLRERLGFYVPGWPRYRNTLPALPIEATL